MIMMKLRQSQLSRAMNLLTYFDIKKRRQPNWSDLPPELLDLILSKLSFLNMLSFKRVCSPWRAATKNSTHPILPWLMLPPTEEKHKDSVFFFSLEDNKVYNLNNILKFNLHENSCVGSSHGWLVILDKNADPFLLNILSQTRIQLPNKETLPHIKSISTTCDDNSNFDIEYKSGFSEYPYQSMSSEDLRRWFSIVKAVLSSNPSRSNNYLVMIIYSHRSKLAFCRHGDGAWTEIQGNHESYSDIICVNSQLFALSHECSTEIWDFHNSFPVKTMEIGIRPFPINIEAENFQSDLYPTYYYLVESSRDILFVVRYTGECVWQPDHLSDEDTENNIRPHNTMEFLVYKLDFNQKQWEEVDSFSDRVIFLSENNSVSLSAQDHPKCKATSIYFTDDYWEDYSYKGHNMGIFSLKDRSIEPFYDRDMLKFEPQPCWVVPNPW